MQNYGEIVSKNSVTYLSPDGFFCLQILPKFNFGRGSAQDPAAGAYSAPPGPLAGGEGAG